MPIDEKSRPVRGGSQILAFPHCGCLKRAAQEHSTTQHMLLALSNLLALARFDPDPSLTRCAPPTVVDWASGSATYAARLDERCLILLHVTAGNHYPDCAAAR